MLYNRSLLFIHFKYSSVYISIPNYPFPSATVSSFSKSAFSFALYFLFGHKEKPTGVPY